MTFEIDGLNEMHVGNRFFMHKYRTIDIAHTIKAMNTFEEFENYYNNELMDGNILLQVYLSELLTRYKVKAEQVSKKIGYSHDYVRKIAVGERQNPRRDVLLAICVYLHATVEETQLLLRYAGQQPLYARRKRDAIIWFALEKKQDLKALDEFLYNRDYDTIGKY